MNFCEIETSLDYTVSSKTARNCFERNQEEKERGGKGKGKGKRKGKGRSSQRVAMSNNGVFRTS